MPPRRDPPRARSCRRGPTAGIATPTPTFGGIARARRARSPALAVGGGSSPAGWPGARRPASRSSPSGCYDDLAADVGAREDGQLAGGRGVLRVDADDLREHAGAGRADVARDRLVRRPRQRRQPARQHGRARRRRHGDCRARRSPSTFPHGARAGAGRSWSRSRGALLGFLGGTATRRSCSWATAAASRSAACSPAARRSRSRAPARSLAAAAAALILIVPLFDTTFVVLLRRLAGRSTTRGNIDHTSHRLVSAGFSEPRRGGAALRARPAAARPRGYCAARRRPIAAWPVAVGVRGRRADVRRSIWRACRPTPARTSRRCRTRRSRRCSRI